MADQIFVVVCGKKGKKKYQPVCYLDTEGDAELYIKMLEEDDRDGKFDYQIRPITKGFIRVQL